MKTTTNTHTSAMRTIVSSFAMLFMLAACNGPSTEGTLETLLQQRDSLKAMRTTVTSELAAIEEQIDALDTNKMDRTTNVTTMNVGMARFEHFFTVQGVVETDQNAQIYPEAAGRIMSIPVVEGARVSKGQVLMTLDNSILVQQMEELKSRLSLAETVFKKQEALWQQKIGSELQFLQAKNNYESLKQNLKTLQAQNDMYTITAPFNGVVDEVNLKVGEMAAPQLPAFRLINMEDMYIKSDVTERYLGKIQPGDEVLVTFPSIGRQEKATISRLGNFINPNNRTFKLKLDLPNAESNLKPNLLGELQIRDYVNDSALVIPSFLVQMTPSGEEFVYALEDGQAKKKIISTGMSYQDLVEVTTGLAAGITIIDKGARSIKDGDRVNVIN